MGIYHATIPPVGTIGGVDEPQWAQAHTVDAAGITFHDGTTQTTAYPGSGAAVQGLASGSGTQTAVLAAGATNNLNPGGAWPDDGILLLNSTAGAANITGLVAGVDQQMVLIMNLPGGNNVTLNNQNAGSTLANRFVNSFDLILAPGATVIAVYSSTLAATYGGWALT